MRTGIHPEYKKTLITCACGRVSETRATVDELHVEICSHCHPFFTGRQKLVDTAGRVERFRAKYGADSGRVPAAPENAEEPEAETATAVEEPEAARDGQESDAADAQMPEDESEAVPEAAADEATEPEAEAVDDSAAALEAQASDEGAAATGPAATDEPGEPEESAEQDDAASEKS